MFGGDKLQIVGLNIDDEQELPASILSKRPTAYPQVFLGAFGDTETTTRAFRIQNVPSIWLIGPDGRVIACDPGGENVAKSRSQISHKVDVSTLLICQNHRR